MERNCCCITVNVANIIGTNTKIVTIRIVANKLPRSKVDPTDTNMTSFTQLARACTSGEHKQIRVYRICNFKIDEKE